MGVRRHRRSVIAATSSAGPAFFDTIPMLREFWAEDPSWTNPGNGNAMVTWRDNGSHGADVTAAAIGGGNKPIYVDSGLAGRPSIRFTGTAGGVGGNLSEATGTTGNTRTKVLVFNSDRTTGQTFAPLDSRAYYSYLAIQSGNWFSYSAGGTVSMSDGAADTGNHLMVQRWDAGNHEMFIDGASVATNGGGATTARAGITIGSSYNDLNCADGDIPYVAVYNGDLTAHPDYAEYIHNLLTYYGI